MAAVKVIKKQMEVKARGWELCWSMAAPQMGILLWQNKTE